ncbi:MAG: 3-deoxy-7-phosphoheptulonate synthase [Candidatus Saccharimonadales bacterium]
MSSREIQSTTSRQLHAETIVDELPEPNYPVNYQPTYPSREGLISGVAELLNTSGVTTLENIQEVRHNLVQVGDPEDKTMMVISGACREAISLQTPMRQLALRSQRTVQVAQSSRLEELYVVERGRGQYKKPRSEFEEEDENGNLVPVYMGDVVNGMGFSDRTPDPSRLVAGALQARDLEEVLSELMGGHVPAAHEALSLAYEQAFVVPRSDTRSEGEYSISGDILWGGLRTNKIGSAVLELLKRLHNPVGVKIDGTSDEEHIAYISDELNPAEEPGKLIYMLRLGQKDSDQYGRILGHIREHAPTSIVLFDTHGMTEKVTVDGKIRKIRHIPTIIRHMGIMGEACVEAGVKFGGVHLETTIDEYEYECTDERHPEPTRDGNLDPQANPSQTVRLLNAMADINDRQFA